MSAPWWCSHQLSCAWEPAHGLWENLGLLDACGCSVQRWMWCSVVAELLPRAQAHAAAVVVVGCSRCSFSRTVPAQQVWNFPASAAPLPPSPSSSPAAPPPSPPQLPGGCLPAGGPVRPAGGPLLPVEELRGVHADHGDRHPGAHHQPVSPGDVCAVRPAVKLGCWLGVRQDGSARWLEDPCFVQLARQHRIASARP